MRTFPTPKYFLFVSFFLINGTNIALSFQCQQKDALYKLARNEDYNVNESWELTTPRSNRSSFNRSSSKWLPDVILRLPRIHKEFRFSLDQSNNILFTFLSPEPTKDNEGLDSSNDLRVFSVSNGKLDPAIMPPRGKAAEKILMPNGDKYFEYDLAEKYHMQVGFFEFSRCLR